MQEYRWKTLNNYCILSLNNAANSQKSEIVEICCVKVRNNEVVDLYIKDKLNFDELQKFIGRNNIVGWCIDYHVGSIQYHARRRLKNNFVDVFEPYYRDYKDLVSPCSLQLVYEYALSRQQRQDYDFNDPHDKCMAIKKLYDTQRLGNLCSHGNKSTLDKFTKSLGLKSV